MEGPDEIVFIMGIGEGHAEIGHVHVGVVPIQLLA
jgi:hypothetical protein